MASGSSALPTGSPSGRSTVRPSEKRSFGIRQ
jgi:hypothetical protein